MRMLSNSWEQARLQPFEQEQLHQVFRRGQANLYWGDFVDVSGNWPSPTVIVADGPYGVASYPGDPASHEDLAEWYSPHVAHWSERALPETTLWFWNTEIGWASVHPATAEEWAKMRAKFHCGVGITNVWTEPQVRGEERVKTGHKSVHMNQKPLRLLERIILASSDPGDVVWEPFGGLCSTAVAALNMERQCYSAEILEDYYAAALNRLASHDAA